MATAEQVPPDQNAGKIPAAGAALALLGGPPLAAGAIAPVYISTATAKSVVDGATAATAATMEGVTRMIGGTIQNVLATRYPDATPDLSEIEQRSAAFPVESAARVKKGMAAALAKPTQRMMLQEIDDQLTAEAQKPVPDAKLVAKLTQARLVVASNPGPRERAVSTVLNNEKRYAAMHAELQLGRAVGAANQSRLERTSPEGALWRLGDGVMEHEPHCIALADHVYPHSVLRKLRPPIHGGCACWLQSVPEAISEGRISPGDIPRPKDAIKRAVAAMALHEHDARGLLLVEELKSRGIDLLGSAESVPGVFEDAWDADTPTRLAGRLGRLTEGETLRLPDGTAIRSRPDGFQVRRDGAVKRGLSADAAALNALDRSARSKKPGSLGGQPFKGGFAEYLAEAEGFNILHPRGKGGKFKQKFDALGFGLHVPLKGATAGGGQPGGEAKRPLPKPRSMDPYTHDELEDSGPEVLGPGPWDRTASAISSDLVRGGIRIPGTSGTQDTQRLLKPGGKVQKDGKYEGGEYTPARKRLHDAIIARFLQGTTPQADPEILFMGGGGASGKSTMLKTGGVSKPEGSVLINPDAIKGMIPEYRELIRRGDKGASAAVHEESSDIARALMQQAMATGRHITVDKVKIRPEEVKRAEGLNYRPRGAVATVPIPTALERADARGDKTGRYVSHSELRDAHQTVARQFESWVTDTGMPITLTDTSTGRVIARGDGGQLHVLDQQAYDQFLKRRSDPTA